MTRPAMSIRFLLPAALFVLIAVVLVVAAELGGQRFGIAGARMRIRISLEAAKVASTNIETYLHHGHLDDAQRTLERWKNVQLVESAMVLGADGRVLLSMDRRWNGHSLAETPYAGLTEQVAAVRRSGEVISATTPDFRWSFAAPLRASPEGGAPGPVTHVLAIAADYSSGPARARADAYRFFGMIGALALVALALVSWVLHRTVSAPASRLATAANRFADGARDTRVALEGAEEIRLAGASFNRLADRLAEVEGQEKSQRRLLDTLLRSAPIGLMAVRRSDRQILFVNPAWHEIFGDSYQPGRSHNAAVEPMHFLRTDGSPASVDELPLRRALDTGQAIGTEPFIVARADGARTPVLARALPLTLGEAGTVDAVLSVVQDRREFERATAELLRSERQFEALLESVNVGVLMVSRPEQRVLFRNQRLVELLGSPIAAGESLQHRRPQVERADGIAWTPDDGTIAGVMRDGQVHSRADLVVMNPSGERIPVHVTSAPVNLSGGPEFDAVVTIVQDRRDLDRATAELRMWERRFERATRATGQAVYEWNLADDRCRFSGALESVFGWKPEDVDDNQKWNAFTHPEDLPSVRAEFAASLDERRLFDCVYRFLHRDGTWRWVRDRGFHEFDAEGRHVRMIGSVADVTEQREMETRLRQAQKMETLGTLAGGIAHDFNNQLTAVLGHLALLEDVPAGTPAHPEHLRLARLAAERCAELTRGLLAFSRMLPSDPQPTSVNEVVRETVALMARMVPASIQVRLHLAADLPAAIVDAVQLQQVLFNLCVNARDAMPSGGTLTVRTRAADIAPDEAVDLAPGRYAEISVLDTGTGIPPELLPRIFEPFFTTKPVGQGTGLGLAMVYGIVSQHHGRVEAASEPGFGSTFRVLLPAAPRAAAPARTPASPSRTATDLTGHRVLVVDDEPLVLGYASQVLASAGAQTLPARDGDEALAVCEDPTVAFDLVLMDLTMPGAPVSQVIEQLRQRRPGVAVILTSGFSHASTARKELPELPFLAKPYLPGQLLDAAATALAGVIRPAS